MAVFNYLPTVDSCCFCISLKWGSIIIAILTLFSLGASPIIMRSTHCGERNLWSWPEKEDKYYIPNICSILVHLANIFLFIASIVFLVGIIKDKSQAATFYMYAIAVWIITYLVFGVLITVFYFVIHPECAGFHGVFGFSVGILLMVYFLIVVKSYREEM